MRRRAAQAGLGRRTGHLVLFGQGDVGPIFRLRLLVDRAVGALSGTHPPTRTRLRALHQPVVGGVGPAAGLARATALVVAPVLVLGMSGRAAVGYAAAFDPRSWVPPAALAPELPDARSLLVHTDLGACTLRGAAAVDGEPVAYPANGVCCDALDERGRWLQVVCDGASGWMHGSCLIAEQARSCSGRR